MNSAHPGSMSRWIQLCMGSHRCMYLSCWSRSTMTLIPTMATDWPILYVQLFNLGTVGVQRLHLIYPLATYSQLYIWQYQNLRLQFNHQHASEYTSIYMSMIRAAARHGLYTRMLREPGMFGLPQDVTEQDRQVSFCGHHGDLLDAVSPINPRSTLNECNLMIYWRQ